MVSKQTSVTAETRFRDFRRQLEGYGLTTANILYRRPDHPWLLQTYVWQDYDLCPTFRSSTNSSISGWKSSRARCIR